MVFERGAGSLAETPPQGLLTRLERLADIPDNLAL